MYCYFDLGGIIMTKKIGILVGSLRKDSYNKIVAKQFAELLPEGFEAKFIEIGDLPFYNEDLEVEGSVPEAWTRLRNNVNEVDGLFFVTPEYNRSVPAALKNALDVGSRPMGSSVLGGETWFSCDGITWWPWRFWCKPRFTSIISFLRCTYFATT